MPKRQIMVKPLAEALLGLGVSCKRPSCPPVSRSGRGARQNTAGCAAKGCNGRRALKSAIRARAGLRSI